MSLPASDLGEAVLRRIHKGDRIGGRLHPQSVSKIVKARIKAHHESSNVPSAKAHEDAARYSGHSLRVGFAVTAAEGGADIRSIASVTRHRSLAMPARYAEKAEPDQNVAAQAEGRGAQCGEKCRQLIWDNHRGAEWVDGLGKRHWHVRRREETPPATSCSPIKW